MPITFELFPEQRYFVSVWSGRISDKEVLQHYRAFLSGDDYQPGYDEVADLTKADMSAVSSTTLRQLAALSEAMLTRHNATMKTAVIAPTKLPFGVARIYAAMAEGSPESLGIFNSMDTALHWLGKTR